MQSSMLERAFSEARKRPVSEQDAIASFVLDALSTPVTIAPDRLAAIQAGIARGREDAAAGRIVDVDTLEAELQAEFGVDAD